MTTGTNSRSKRRPRRATLTLIGAGLTSAFLIAASGESSSLGSSADPPPMTGAAFGTPMAASPTAPRTSAPALTDSTESPDSSAASIHDTTLVTAPESARVDLAVPTFSNPTVVTNPRFPIAELDQVIQLGEEAGATLRFEVTLLPDTKVIEWNGQQVETLVSQFVAYENERVLEVAVDFFAQADDGAVWYFGEDVANYVDGAIDNTDGTWLAGKDGPPGMIMPADPQVGDVYRPENIPGFVFEEVTVRAVDETVEGPTGPVEGAIVVQELLMDGLLEDKTFAPGYGEFFFAVEAEDEVVQIALAVPIDAAAGAMPAELTTISAGVEDISGAVAAEDWEALSATLETMTTAWETYRVGDVPPLLETQMKDALDVLAAAVDARNAPAVAQAAIDVGHATLDVQLQFRPPADVDQDRLELWAWQLEIDEAVGDPTLTAGDQVVIETIGQRIGRA